MDDSRRAVEESAARGAQETLLARAAELLWRAGAMGHLDARLDRRPRARCALPGAYDRLCDQPELGTLCAGGWNAREHGCAVGIHRAERAASGGVHGSAYDVRGD